MNIPLRDEIGAVIGGEVADRDKRAGGMVVGGVLGAVLGHGIGDRMGDRDRVGMGHALKLGRAGVPVVWRRMVTPTTSPRAAMHGTAAARPR